MTMLTAAPWFGILITLAIWHVALQLNQRWRTPLLNPVFVSITAIILLLLAGGISFENYNVGGKWLSFLLQPAVVALAIPLTRQIRLVHANRRAVAISMLCGSVCGIVTATVFALLLGGSEELARTIAPKSVTTPIAMSIAAQTGGHPSLTAAIVIITGIFGAMIGPEAVRLLRLRGPIPIGLAVGAAAHGIGTARILQDEGHLAGAFSGIAMTLNGLLTAIILPYLLPLILKLFT